MVGHTSTVTEKRWIIYLIHQTSENCCEAVTFRVAKILEYARGRGRSTIPRFTSSQISQPVRCCQVYVATDRVSLHNHGSWHCD